MLKHEPRTPATRRLATLAGAVAPLLFAGTLAAAGANAAVGARLPAGAGTASETAATAGKNPDPASGPHRQAYDPVTGKTVTVYKPAGSTPVHPEKLTHPGSDDMGTATSAHGGGKPAAAAGGPPGLVFQRNTAAATAAPKLPGIDVSSHQGNINWSSVAPHVDFVYAKATEGTYYRNPYFPNQYNGPYNHGVIRGAYHFGIPNNSRGAAQANYFVAHGGRWSGDGKTLPGALDVEYNPYGAECYGLSKSVMRAWIWDFVNEYAYDTGVYPVIYSTYGWWNTCTGNASGFNNYDPLWIARYSSSAGTLPAGYGYYTFWQYASSGSEPGDQDVFNGNYSRLQALARE